MSCGLILLAAGDSSRMGKPKQLLFFNGKSLIQNSLETLLQANVQQVVVITGAHAAAIKKEIISYKINIVENASWQQGIASSIRCGVSYLMNISPQINAIILMLCDQPFITSQLLDNLITTAQNSNRNIVACSYANTFGTPAYFGQQYFNELLKLQGDEGAKKIISRHIDDTAIIPFPEGDIDIDNIRDYEALMGKAKKK